ARLAARVVVPDDEPVAAAPGRPRVTVTPGSGVDDRAGEIEHGTRVGGDPGAANHVFGGHHAARVLAPGDEVVGAVRRHRGPLDVADPAHLRPTRVGQQPAVGEAHRVDRVLIGEGVVDVGNQRLPGN